MQTILLLILCVVSGVTAYKLISIERLLKHKIVEDDEFGMTNEHMIEEYKSDRKNDYDLAVDYVHMSGKASTSSLQSEFKWGYNRAARIIAKLEDSGIVGPPRQGERYRKVLTLSREPGYVSSEE
ncbi:MAG: hypothetical protein KBC50_00005 [Candidatus Pacebacteria bacterium]|nr:hypothetical protein [Candidatus Paceibacterota bacterium]